MCSRKQVHIENFLYKKFRSDSGDHFPVSDELQMSFEMSFDVVDHRFTVMVQKVTKDMRNIKLFGQEDDTKQFVNPDKAKETFLTI